MDTLRQVLKSLLLALYTPPALTLAIGIGTAAAVHTTPASAQARRDTLTIDDRKVLAAILDQATDWTADVQIISQTQKVSESWLRDVDTLSALSAETRADWLVQNRKQTRLTPKSADGRTIALIEEKEARRLMTRPVIQLTRIGFDRNRRQALVHVMYSCGMECGRGVFLFLERENNEWRVRNRLITIMI